jgi:hypothetical protein
MDIETSLERCEKALLNLRTAAEKTGAASAFKEAIDEALTHYEQASEGLSSAQKKLLDWGDKRLFVSIANHMEEGVQITLAHWLPVKELIDGMTEWTTAVSLLKYHVQRLMLKAC